MVVPMAAVQGPSGQVRNLGKYKALLISVAAGYAAVVVLQAISNDIADSIFYVFLAVVAGVMAMRGEECMGQCVQVLVFFAVITLLFDVMTMITKLVANPGASRFFTQACPENMTIIIPVDTRVYNTTNFTLNDSFVVSENNTGNASGLTAIFERNFCSRDLVRQDIAIVAGIVLDLYTSLVGYFMWKTAYSVAPTEERVLLEGADAAEAGFVPFSGPPETLGD